MMYYLTIHGEPGHPKDYTFTPYSSLADALWVIGAINDDRRWVGLGDARFSLVRKRGWR